MYDKGNSIHHNGAKLAAGVKGMDRVKASIEQKVKIANHPVSKAQDSRKPLTNGSK